MSHDIYTNAHTPILSRGQIVPAFVLPGPDGMPHSPWDYKQREHLVLLFTPSAHNHEGKEFLHVFAQHYREFREEVCALLAITAEPVVTNMEAQAELHLPFALLADLTGTVIAQYTTWDAASRTLIPCVILADRYGAVHEQWIASHEAELPSIDNLLETLRYLNRLCTP